MPRDWLFVSALAIIGLVVLFSGCSRETGGISDPNNTTLTGHVYFNGKPAGGAGIEAAGADGIHGSNAVTDSNGAYVLFLPSLALKYSVTATHQGVNQTVGPIQIALGRNYPRDIQMTAGKKSIITGSATLDGRAKNIQIVATPANGGRALTSNADERGNFTLYVDPGVTYSLSGTFSTTWGMAAGMTFWHNDDYPIRDVTLNPGQTFHVEYAVFIVHPPKEVSPPPVNA